MPDCTNICTLATSALPFIAQICVLWPFLYLLVHKYVYFGHFSLTFHCTDMCTLAISLSLSAQICVLWPLHPYFSLHKYVYFGHFSLTFHCTNMCTLATSLSLSAQICVLWPLQPYHWLHKYVYFGHFNIAQICVLRPLNVNLIEKYRQIKRESLSGHHHILPSPDTTQRMAFTAYTAWEQAGAFRTFTCLTSGVE
jgi:hypothetical protein